MRRGWVSAWTTLVRCRSASSGLPPPCATLEPQGLSRRRDDGGKIYQGGHDLDPIERSLKIGLTAGTQATSTHQVPFLPDPHEIVARIERDDRCHIEGRGDTSHYCRPTAGQCARSQRHSG